MSKFLTRYNHANPKSPTGGDSMTDPQFAADCDLNTIVKKAGLGVPPPVRKGMFGDFSEIGDFASVMDKVEQAKKDFASLPSNIRDRFANDPKQFAAFALDPANVDECIRLGIRERVVCEPSAVDVLKEINSKITAGAANPA